ncbi:Ubiquitin-conjugating enzyme E2 J1 [Quaeritorhiza haematococci]|nr:Ubiquitin-conjugating enzyme E2 J1 [Quaeritorhiza haematococci]
MSTTSRSPAVKRLMKELAELNNDPSPEFVAAPVDDNVFEWHFTIRGPSEGGFAGGRYHGRIIFPPDYPFKPPNISFLTPNGRFEVGKKICLSITGHHPEYWRPAWGVRSALVALISFMPTKGDGAIGALDYTEEERKVFATKSRNWVCPHCGSRNATALPDESERPVEKLQGDSEITFSVKAEGATGNDTSGQQSNVESSQPQAVASYAAPVQSSTQATQNTTLAEAPSQQQQTQQQIQENVGLRQRIVNQQASSTQLPLSPPTTTTPLPQTPPVVPPSNTRQQQQHPRAQVMTPAAPVPVPDAQIAVNRSLKSRIDMALSIVLFLLGALVMRRVVSAQVL